MRLIGCLVCFIWWLIVEDKLSILVLLPFFPFPPDDGGKIASYTFIENLRHKHNFTVLVPVHNAEQIKLASEQRKTWPDVRIESAQYDMSTLRGKALHFFSDVIFAVKQVIKSESSVFGNKNLVFPFFDYNAVYFDALMSLLRGNEYDVIQSEYVQSLAWVDCLPKESKKIYVEVESRYSLLEDYVSLEPVKSREYCRHIVEKVKTIESAYLAKYDALVAYSSDDQLRLQQLLPGKAVYKSPLNLIRESPSKKRVTDFFIDKIIFIGHEQHEPNKDAVIWFIEEIYPHLSRFDKKFYVVGRWGRAFIRKYSKVPGVVFSGFVDDIDDFIKNSINVAPIRLGGGGIRMKVLLSISNGVPVVCTSKACHGFDFVHGHNSMVAETAAEFVASMSELLSAPETAEKLARNAYQLYKENYSVVSTTSVRDKVYRDVVSS